MSKGLAQRSIDAVAWNGLVNVISIGVLYVRAVMLARLVPVEVFGIFSFADSIIVLATVFIGFGLNSALLNRSEFTDDEQQAAAVYFTLQLIIALIWTVILVIIAATFSSGQTRLALYAMIGATAVGSLTATPRALLIRRVVHRRLALIAFAETILSTIIALILAYSNYFLLALLSVTWVSVLLNLFLHYVYRPVWRPRVVWQPQAMRYFLNYGSQSLGARLLGQMLDRVDDIWTRVYLGNTALGFYGRAYAFANYPRRLLAVPVYEVAGGTYAELKHDRQRLSQAFVRTNGLLIRSGFFMGGILVLIAPEFIRLQLTAKWLPMLDAFRLMVIYTLLSPLKATVAQLFTVVGQPGRVVKARLVQIIILVVGLFTLGPPFGIAGVALAVDIMLVVGLVQLLWLARELIDYSVIRLFLVPTAAVTVGLLLGRLALLIPGVLGSDWRTAIVKTLVFTACYLLVALAFERKQMIAMLKLMRNRLPWPRRR